MSLAAPPTGDSEFSSAINQLEHLLKHLPTALPFKTLKSSRYRDVAKLVTEEKIQDIGSKAGAANRALEITFPPSDRVSAEIDRQIPVLSEQGPGVCALTTFLENHHSTCPDESYMLLWTQDLILGAEHAFKQHNQVSCHFSTLSTTHSCCVMCSAMMLDTPSDFCSS
jgi:hypothetical protein